jgi:hypothetical protein
VPYQYTEAQLAAAVAEADRTGSFVGVHCTGEPGASYAAEAGVASIDHAYDLSPATMKLMREKQIYAVPTFAIMEYFCDHPLHGDGSEDRRSWRITLRSSRSRWPRACRLRWGRTWGRFRMGRRRASWS